MVVSSELVIVCAWCNVRQHGTEYSLAPTTRISHTICPACLARVERELELVA